MARSEVALACNSVPPRAQRRLPHWLLRPSGGLRGELRAKRIMISHMNPTMLARLDEARAEGLLVAEDGLCIEI